MACGARLELVLGLALLVTSACQKSSIHGSGYGGSDALWTQLNAGRTIVMSRINSWRLSAGNSEWCRPINCEANPHSCQVARALHVNPRLSGIVRDYLADKGRATRWLERARASNFEIEESLPADALTPLVTDGSFTVKFDASRMQNKTAAEQEFTWAHELAHAVEGKDDEDDFFGVSFQDAADAISACLNLGPVVITDLTR